MSEFSLSISVGPKEGPLCELASNKVGKSKA